MDVSAGYGTDAPQIAASGLQSDLQQRHDEIPHQIQRNEITSAPRDESCSVTSSIDMTSAPSANRSNVSAQLIGNTARDFGRGSIGPKVQVHSVAGMPRQPEGGAAPSGLLAPATSEDSNTQMSSDSGSVKPPSLDGKSVASGTTFALDEKESLRPDDSASAKAADDEDAFSPPSADLPSSHIGSDDARAFHDQLREISSMDPQRRAATPQEFRTAGHAQAGVLYVPPQGSGVGIVPASRPDPERASSADNPPDPKLLEALESPRDRIWVLKLEQDIFDFVKDPAESSLNLPQCNAYHRMLAHKIADYYMLGHIVDDSASAVRLYKTPSCRIPPPLTGITTPSTAASTPPPAAPQMKILRRGIDSGPVLANGSNIPSKGGSEDGDEDDKKPKMPASREEREARYEAARLRIMGSARPTETLEESKPKTDSRSSSVNGKKSKKKQRSSSDDEFEARSAYSAYYTPPYNSTGYNTSYGFAAFADTAPAQQVVSPTTFQQQAGPNVYPQYAAQTQQSMPWATQGYPGNSGIQHWPQTPQSGYDMSANFQQAMSFQNQMQSPQNGNAAQNCYPSYQQHPYGGQQTWPQQPQQPSPQAAPQNSNAVPAGYQHRPQSSLGQRDHQPYRFGQLPSQALGRPASKLEHPLPGSYKGKHFNPQSQTFVPGQQGQQNDMPVQSFTPPNGAVNGGVASPRSRQPSTQSQTPTFGSSPQASVPSSGAHGQSQPMLHPLPQPVFMGQPSPSLPLPPKPGSTSQSTTHQQPMTPSPSTNSQGQSSIAKWGAPASLPAKPPPPAEPFDPGRFSHLQRQPSYNAAAAARMPSGGMPSFGSMPPATGGLGVDGTDGARQ